MAQQQAQRDKAAQNPDMTVGDILRKTRIHYEQSVADIERVLHIKAAQIEAMENNHFHKLPGTVYAIGFIRTYSEYLGLDGDKMVSLFKSQSGARPVKPELSKLPATIQDSRTPNWWLLAASFMAMIGITVMWVNASQSDRSVVETIPAVPPAISVASTPTPKPAPQQQAAAAASDQIPAGPAVPSTIATAAPDAVSATETETTQTAAAAPAKQQDGIILKITQNSWVEIKDNSGKAVVSRVLKAGDKYFVPARSDLFMSLGNSGGVKLEIDGVELPNIGAPGQVMRNIPLDIASLRKQFAKALASPAH